MSPAELTLRLSLAVGLGAVIGIECEFRRKPAGLRTNMLIALGSALFTILSMRLAQVGGTPDRISAQIVTGIGFLGAGAIMRSGTNVHGMTTAATPWSSAATSTSWSPTSGHPVWVRSSSTTLGTRATRR